MMLMEGKRKSNKNEASKEKKTLCCSHGMGCIFFKRKTEKISVSCVTAWV